MNSALLVGLRKGHLTSLSLCLLSCALIHGLNLRLFVDALRGSLKQMSYRLPNEPDADLNTWHSPSQPGLEVYNSAGRVSSDKQTVPAVTQPFLQHQSHTDLTTVKDHSNKVSRNPWGLSPLLFGCLVGLVTALVVGGAIGGGLGSAIKPVEKCVSELLPRHPT